MSVSTPRRPGGASRDKISSRVHLTDYLLNRAISEEDKNALSERRKRIAEGIENRKNKIKEQELKLKKIQEDVEITAEEYVQRFQKQQTLLDKNEAQLKEKEAQLVEQETQLEEHKAQLEEQEAQLKSYSEGEIMHGERLKELEIKLRKSNTNAQKCETELKEAEDLLLEQIAELEKLLEISDE